MAPVRWGVVGLGRAGLRIARAISRVGGTELVSVCERRADLHALAHDQLGIRSVTTLQELWGTRPDVVAVCTPPRSHARLAEGLLLRGADVLIEKPPCLTLPELDRLRQHEDVTGMKVHVVAQYRANPVVQELRSLLDGGALGRPSLAIATAVWRRDAPYFAESPWRSKRAHGGGLLANQFFHHLDLLIHLFGDPNSFTAVHADNDNTAVDIEQSVTAALDLGDGCAGALACSVAGPSGKNLEQLDVVTPRAIVRLEGPRLAQISVTGAVPEAVLGRLRVASARIDTDEPDLSLFDAIIEQVNARHRDRSEPAVSLTSTAKVVGLINRIYPRAA